jgi:hypothetical protein
VKVKGEGEERIVGVWSWSSSLRVHHQQPTLKKNKEICNDHSLQTVVITKPTAGSNRFLALLYLSQSLPKLPPHFAKCGGN